MIIVNCIPKISLALLSIFLTFRLFIYHKPVYRGLYCVTKRNIVAFFISTNEVLGNGIEYDNYYNIHVSLYWRTYD